MFCLGIEAVVAPVSAEARLPLVEAVVEQRAFHGVLTSGSSLRQGPQRAMELRNLWSINSKEVTKYDGEGGNENGTRDS